MNIQLSKKQKKLVEDVTSKDIPEIYVVGSTQSGKTYSISLATILYAQSLHKFNPKETFYGAIIGWSINSIKGNILDVMERFLNGMGLYRKYKGIGDYIVKWGSSDEKFIQLWNLKLYFFSFNNVLSFNNILGKPLIFEWIDESARIYSQSTLQDSFKELPGRQMSYANHPYLKTVHSFNVEGNENHPYKLDFLDAKPNAKHYSFFPYDNPKIDSPEAIRKVLEMFPKGSALQKQKVFNEWVIAGGRVFPELNVIDNLSEYMFREIGIGIDYGSTNPTTFVPIALAQHKATKQWKLIRLQTYYHDPKKEEDTPTTEYYSKQLRLYLVWLKSIYGHIPITTAVLDSEATHFHNRLLVDNIKHDLATKGAGSVNEGVEHLQSLVYKEYFLIYKHKTIKEMSPNGTPIYAERDESLTEYESYQYDKIKSLKTGQNCFKKEFDHSIDATRYLLADWVEQGKCPQV